MKQAIEQYLHTHIPITRAMEISVVCAQHDKVVLQAPLAPNINHRDTVFGGSAATLAITAAWTLLYLRLRDHPSNPTLVIQSHSMSFIKPIAGDFLTQCELTDNNRWKKFMAALEKFGRGRIALHAELLLQDEIVAEFEGEFVAVS